MSFKSLFILFNLRVISLSMLVVANTVRLAIVYSEYPIICIKFTAKVSPYYPPANIWIVLSPN